MMPTPRTTSETLPSARRTSAEPVRLGPGDPDEPPQEVPSPDQNPETLPGREPDGVPTPSPSPQPDRDLPRRIDPVA